jgi:hypothetical protein
MHVRTEYYRKFEKRFHPGLFSCYMLFCVLHPRKKDQSRDLNGPCSLDGGLTQKMLHMVVELCHCKRTSVSMICSRHLKNNKMVMPFLLKSLYNEVKKMFRFKYTKKASTEKEKESSKRDET